jgi:hypothetical protein
MSLILLVADGARFDTIDDATREGTLPALARLRTDGALHRVATAFPSVTGVAYAPFLTGRFPGPAGLPGLRWFDRARSRCRRAPHARSYLGTEMRHVDADLDPATPTLFELAPSRFNAMSMLGRGARRGERIGRDGRTLLRVARTHWRGDAAAWCTLDAHIARVAQRRIRDHAPAFTCLAMMGLDKASHANGRTSPLALGALAVIDQAVASIRDELERAGRWESTHLWVVSDHGHSHVRTHEDLAQVVRDAGHRVLAHPWLYTRRTEVAVMVSGNAMAHLYLELDQRERPGWGALAPRWEPLARALLARDSVDLLMLRLDAARTELRARGRGTAIIERTGNRLSYHPVDGDPLGVGAQAGLDSTAAYDLMEHTDYPDAIVQIAQLMGSARSGDIILSAAPGWDFRARFEPIPHVSTHGSLHRDHMLVPLITNHPLRGHPRRTADIMPSALDALHLAHPSRLDGLSFF